QGGGDYGAPKVALAPPSLEAKRQLACKSVDLESGEAPSGRAKAFSECFRVDRKGKTIDTQYRLMSHQEASYAKHDREDGAVRKAASAPRNGSAPAPNSGNAWSQHPWGPQQQWGWQSGSGQQWRDDRREWKPSRETVLRSMASFAMAYEVRTQKDYDRLAKSKRNAAKKR